MLLYCCLTFSPKRSLLEACYVIFSIPRVVLVRELPAFAAAAAVEEAEAWITSKGQAEAEGKRQCLLWIWLVLIASLVVANTKRSSLGRDVATPFVKTYPAYRSWEAVQGVLNRFFASDVVVEALRGHWKELGLELEDGET